MPEHEHHATASTVSAASAASVQTIPVTFELLRERQRSLAHTIRYTRHQLEVYLRHRGVSVPDLFYQQHTPQSDALMEAYSMMGDLAQEQQAMTQMINALWETLGPDARREIKPSLVF